MPRCIISQRLHSQKVPSTALYTTMSNNNNGNNNNERRSERNNNNNDDEESNHEGIPNPGDLHEAILANSRSVVEHYLRHGANPNRSPPLAPVSVITSSNQERARDLHRTLGRVFRSRQSGVIRPIHVAVCNAYHNCSRFKRANALGILKALLEGGADPRETCSGIAFCKIGVHPTVTVASAKGAAKVALFLKRFPLKDLETECSDVMDEVATLILDAEAKRTAQSETDNSTTMVPKSVKASWRRLFEEASTTHSDICFVCSDGEVPAHKAVLAASVPYFAAAFQGPWRESGENGRWNTTNSCSIVKAVLRFVYTGELDDNLLENDTTTLLSVAAEYQMESLQDVCVRKCIEQLKESNVKSTLELAALHSLDELKRSCFDFIKENSATILTDTAFISLATENAQLWQELVSAVRSRKRRRGE